MNFNALFAAIHNEVTCPHCMALAQQQTDSNSTAQQPQAVGYENDDGTNDIDGTTAGDTGELIWNRYEMEMSGTSPLAAL